MSHLRNRESLSSPLLDLLAPQYLLSQGISATEEWQLLPNTDITIYRRKQALPRARLYFSTQRYEGPLDLDTLRHSIQDAHDTIMTAVENVLKDGDNLTRDMGGTANTVELGKAIEAAV